MTMSLPPPPSSSTITRGFFVPGAVLLFVGTTASYHGSLPNTCEGGKGLCAVHIMNEPWDDEPEELTGLSLAARHANVQVQVRP